MVIADQCHITRFKEYEDLKIDKDIEYNNDDLVMFYQEVLARREDLDKERRKKQK